VGERCDRHVYTQIQAFREALNRARSLARALPGGELLIEEQDEIIAMLERLREKKRYVRFVVLLQTINLYYYLYRSQLREFLDKVIDTKAAGYRVPQYASVTGGGAGASNVQMEVDSNASTPA